MPPVLYILAGPDGAGKTTLYESAIGKGFIDPALPFINVDLIARNDLGGYSQENFIKAELLYRQRVSEHICAGAIFMIENSTPFLLLAFLKYLCTRI